MRYDALAAICDGTLYNSQRGDASFSGVSIDSRTVSPGQLFIAIRGEQNDGHDYIDQAIKKGANGILAQFDFPRLEHIGGETAVVAVKDSHKAMLRLASSYRDSLVAKFVGITGSNGKTTTKELCYCLLKALEEKTYRSPGNLNNLFGVPLALFAIDDDAKIVVQELGISTKNEMPKLAEIVHPDVIVLTNVGSSHLEFLSTVEDVARAKLELVKNADTSVPVLINADDPVLMNETKRVRNNFITFAIDSNADFKPDSIEMQPDGTSIVTIENNLFKLPLLGRHQAYNLIAAYAVARTLGYSFFDVDTQSISLETAPMRGQTIKVNDLTIISDCYNANPESMKAGLKAFFEIPTDKRRVLILGDMLELGKKSPAFHEEIGEYLSDNKFDLLITVGKMAEYIHKNCNFQDTITVQYRDSNEATLDIKDLIKPGDLIYIKASRGIGLDKVLDVLQLPREEA